MRCPLPCLGLAAATLTLPVLAADGDTPLLEVIVTGRAPASLTVPDIDAARAELATVPGGAGVVEAADEQRGRSSTLQDSLGFATGVFVQPRFGAEESRLSIRGSGVQRTFHLRGIRLLQDGVPVNQADGGGDFQVLDPLALEYTEVWRGANALRFGAATLGGAVNFISPTARSPAGAGSRLHFEAGSHGYLRPFASYGAADSQRDGYLAISGFAQEGFREHAEQETWRLSGNWGERLGAGVENRVWIGAVNSNSELPGNLTKAQMRRDPTAAAAGNVALDQQRNFDLFRIADQLTLVKDGARTDFAAYFVHKDLHHPIFQVLHQVSQDAGLSLIHTLEAPLAGRANRLTAGVLASWGRLDDHRWVNLAGHTGAPTAHNEGTAWNLEAFIENQHEVIDRLWLVTGLQGAIASRRIDDRFPSDGDQSYDDSWRSLNPKLGLRWQATPGVQFYTNLSRSVEPPSFGELRGGTGAPELDAQTGWTLEIGSRGEAGPASWDVSLYRARIDGELLGLNDGSGNPLGTINAGRTIHQGLELGLELRPGADLHLRASYLLNDFRFDGDPVYGNKRLAGIPRQLLRTELLWETAAGFYAGPTAEWSPDRYPVDLANTLYADDYAIWGFKAGWQPKRGRNAGLSLFIEARNLSNTTYAATTGVIADARGRDSAQFLPGDGRSVYAGVDYRF